MFKLKKRKRAIGTSIVLFALVILTACQSTNGNGENAESAMRRKEAEQIHYDVYDMPGEFEDPNMLQMYLITSGDLPEFIFKMKMGNQIEYRSSKMQPDGTWKSSKTKWSDNYVKEEKAELTCMLSDSKGVLYGIASDETLTIQKLYRLYPEGKIEELDIKAALKAEKNKELCLIELINSNRMVLMFSKKNAEYFDNLTTLEYDLTEEKVVGEEGKISNGTAMFDENGLYYTASSSSSEQIIIVGKKTSSSATERVIKCDCMTDLYSQVLIKDGFGYIMTDKGICGGSVNDVEWKVIIPVEEMYIPKDFNNIEEGKLPESAILCLAKVSGNDREFFCMTKSGESADAKIKWVHYYDDK